MKEKTEKKSGKKRIRRGTMLILIGLLMLLVAGGVYIHNIIKEAAVGDVTDEVLDRLENLIVNAPSESVKVDESLQLELESGLQEKPSDENNKKDDKETTAEETEEPTTRDPNNMEYSIVDNHYYIGILDLPTLGLTFPVQWGWSDELMDIAPCRYDGNTTENNMILLAHNYTTHFGRLFDLQPGHKLSFTDIHGHVIGYEVSYVEQFHRSEIHRIYEGEWDLTLFTCVPNTYNRIAVRCKRISG